MRATRRTKECPSGALQKVVTKTNQNAVCSPRHKDKTPMPMSMLIGRSAITQTLSPE